MTNWKIDLASDVPPSRQLVELALDAIATGKLGAGDRLPSVRGLASESLVNPNTVAKAYRDLESMGATVGRNGRGVFVTEEARAIARRERRATTLSAFRRAAREALRAGNPVERLANLLMDEEGKRDSA